MRKNASQILSSSCRSYVSAQQRKPGQATLLQPVRSKPEHCGSMRFQRSVDPDHWPITLLVECHIFGLSSKAFAPPSCLECNRKYLWSLRSGPQGRRHTVTWEWQVWRTFGDIRETFEEKGWGSGFTRRDDNGTMPLLAESGDYCIAFFKRDPGTGECWFELRDKARRRRVFVHSAHSIQTPKRAVELLANHGGPLYEITHPDNCLMYGLPVAPAAKVAEAG